MATLAVLLSLHILSAVVWVGGMFAAYMCLRPAVGALEPPQRLRLWRAFFQKFFPWVWAAVLLLLASGYWMLIMTFGGFAVAPLGSVGLSGSPGVDEECVNSGLDKVKQSLQ